VQAEGSAALLNLANGNADNQLAMDNAGVILMVTKAMAATNASANTQEKGQLLLDVLSNSPRAALDAQTMSPQLSWAPAGMPQHAPLPHHKVKTNICKRWTKHGICTRVKCTFLHGTPDMQPHSTSLSSVVSAAEFVPLSAQSGEDE